MSVLINLLVVVTTAETRYQACPIDNYWFQILLSTRSQRSKARFKRSEAPKLPKLCRNPVQCAVAWGAGGLDWALSLVHTGPQLSADDTWATPAVPGQIKEWGYLLCTVDGEDWRCQIIRCLKSNLIFRASDIWHQPTKTVLADIKMQTCKHKDFLQFNDVDLSLRMIIQNWLSEMNESSEFVDRARAPDQLRVEVRRSERQLEVSPEGQSWARTNRKHYIWKLSITLCFAEKTFKVRQSNGAQSFKKQKGESEFG